MKTKLIVVAALAVFLGVHGSAQTPTPTPTPAPDAPLTATTMRAAMDLKLKAKPPLADDIISICTPYITGPYSFSSAQGSLTNLAIHFVGRATTIKSGEQAGHDFLLNNQSFMEAASLSARLGHYADAVREQQQAIDAFIAAGGNTAFRNRTLQVLGCTLARYKVQAGQYHNTDVLNYLNSLRPPLDKDAADQLYRAYNPLEAAPAIAVAFYNRLILAVENNADNADFIGKIRDQINKLSVN